MSYGRDDMERKRFDDLKEAYVLGALTGEERAWFEDYLATHPELQSEVDELASFADLLALAPQEYEPSPELRRNLLSRIGGATEGSPVERSRRRAWLPGLFGPGRLAAAAVLALVVAGMVVWNISLRGENEALQGKLHEEKQKTYELQGTGAAQNVRGEVIRVGDERAVLIAENLPQAPEGKVYEAWLVRDDVPEPSGLFEPSEEGAAAAPIEGSLKDTDAVAVTLEPSGGSSAPTDDPLLTANL